VFPTDVVEKKHALCVQFFFK